MQYKVTVMRTTMAVGLLLSKLVEKADDDLGMPQKILERSDPRSRTPVALEYQIGNLRTHCGHQWLSFGHWVVLSGRLCSEWSRKAPAIWEHRLEQTSRFARHVRSGSARNC